MLTLCTHSVYDILYSLCVWYIVLTLCMIYCTHSVYDILYSLCVWYIVPTLCMIYFVLFLLRNSTKHFCMLFLESSFLICSASNNHFLCDIKKIGMGGVYKKMEQYLSKLYAVSQSCTACPYIVKSIKTVWLLIIETNVSSDNRP